MQRTGQISRPAPSWPPHTAPTGRDCRRASKMPSSVGAATQEPDAPQGAAGNPNTPADQRSDVQDDTKHVVMAGYRERPDHEDGEIDECQRGKIAQGHADGRGGGDAEQGDEDR